MSEAHESSPPSRPRRAAAAFSPGPAAAALLGAGCFLWPVQVGLHFGLDAAGRLAVVLGVAAGVVLSRRLGGVPSRAVAAAWAAWCLGQPVLCGLTGPAGSGVGVALSAAVVGLLAVAPGVACGLRLAGGRGAFASAAAGVVVAWAAAAAVPFGWLVGLTVVAAAGIAARVSGVGRPAAAVGSSNTAAELAALAAASLLLGCVGREAAVWTLGSTVTVAGVALGMVLATGVRRVGAAAAVLLVGGGLLSAGSESLLEAAVRVTATWPTVWALATVRVLAAAAAVFVPAACVAAACRGGRRDARVALAAGLVCIGVTGWVSIQLAAMAACLLAVPAAWSLAVGQANPRRWAVAGAAAGGVAAAAFGLTSEAPALAAKSLFAPDAFAAVRTGRTFPMALAADEGRLVEAIQTPEGPLTVWDYGGVRREFRRGGVRDGSATADPAVSPRPAADVMAAVLPLTLHPGADSVLILGEPSGETTRAALEFPVRRITVVETAARLKAVGAPGWSDGRLKTINARPARGLTPDGGPADAVIVRPFNTASLTDAACFRPEWFAAAAARLKPGGVFCQRLATADMDASGLLAVAEAVRAAVGPPAVFVTGPAEAVVLARKGDAVAFGERQVARLKKSHVVRVLSEAGYDWSVVADLTAYTPEQLAEAAAAREVPACGDLPRTGLSTLMSWRPKAATFAALAEGHASRPVQWLENVATRQEVAARVDDAKERFRIQSRNPDQFWAYRKPLRGRLQERPREVIRQVKFEEPKKVLHPDDERRKAYFLALDAAIESRNGGLLAAFAAPFDPLVSPFVHAEAARVYGVAGDRDAQLRSLLAATYAAGDGLSVRPVNDALTLVLDGVGGSAGERYDLAQGLLEQLRRRWPARMAVDGQVRMASSDLRESIAVAKRAVAELPPLAAGDPSRGPHCDRRLPVLRHDLIETLRTYQSRREAAETNDRFRRAAEAVRKTRS